MNPFRSASLALLVGLATMAPPLRAGDPKPAPKPVADAAGLLAQARAAYPALGEHGFRGYRFMATPDWPATLQELARTNPTGYEAALKLLRQIRFEVRVGPHGQSQVAHNLVDTPNETSTSGLNQVYAGVEQALNGFFQTWSPFMVQSPIPPAGTDCQVRDLGAQYQMSWDEQGGVHVELHTDRAFAVAEMKIASPAFDAVVTPRLQRHKVGYVLTGYEGTYTPKDGGAAMTLVVAITNQTLEDMPLPSGLEATVHTGGRTEHMTFTFSDLKAEPKLTK